MDEHQRKYAKECEDRLSSLPDCLLVSILSLLPTKTAISTSVLSHRWQHLCTHLSHLSFTGPAEHHTEDQRPEFLTKIDNFLSTVGNILSHLTSPKIQIFHLNLKVPRYDSDYDRYDLLVGSWVRQVWSRHPEDISVILDSHDYKRTVVKLPAACIFNCDTIVSLDFGTPGLAYYLPDNGNDMRINLPNLKKLRMFLNDQSHRLLSKTLFKCCPLLEDLYLRIAFEVANVVDIYCLNLKSLEIEAFCYNAAATYVIDAPNLENLTIIGETILFWLVSKPCRLANVKLGIWTHFFRRKADFIVRVTHTLHAIASVRSLDLYGNIIANIREFENQGMVPPVFHNLTELSINGFDYTDFGDLLAFLKYCPSLEVLVLDGSVENESDEIWEVPAVVLVPSCLVTKLRVLELSHLYAADYNLHFVMYFVRNGGVLEKLRINIVGGFSSLEDELAKQLNFCTKVFLHPKKCSVRDIKFSSHFIKATSKRFKNGLPDFEIRSCDTSDLFSDSSDLEEED